MTRRLFLAFLSLCLIPGLLSAREAREQTRIDGLIAAVEALKGGKFLRNGSEYDAATAASHLRMKLSRAGERVKTAEEFIEGIASKSSSTGQAYRIRQQGGQEEDAAAFFRARLTELDRAKK